MIKQMVALLSIASLGAGVVGCGGATGRAGSTSRMSIDGEPITSVSPKLGALDGDDSPVVEFGGVPKAAELNKISALVHRYYEAAAAEDGARACSMLYVAAARSVVDEEGRLPDLHGTTCAVVVSKLFKLHHQQLVADLRSLKIVSVRAERFSGHVLLRFANAPESRNLDVRLDGTWKVQQALDNQMP